MRCYELRAAMAALTILAGTAVAQDAEQPRLHTNEAYVEEATRPATLAIGDPMAVFAFVLGSLPDKVKVYPTENYYYFRFMQGGVPYAGNIRLDPLERDRGKVQFSYYADLSEWRDKMQGDTYVVLDASRGVSVERLERLLYRVSYRGKSVVFALNDLSQVKPPAGALGPDDKFLGPIFDESAVRFFLVYNSRLKVFHYILDETAKVPDELTASARSDRILIGRRTGFAFYRDHRLDRKIMIGAFESNARLNTYFDGPFDQLPENFIEGGAAPRNSRGRPRRQRPDRAPRPLRQRRGALPHPTLHALSQGRRSAGRPQVRDRQNPGARLLPVLRQRR